MNQAANINSDICTCISISYCCSLGADGATDMDLVGGNDSINTPDTILIYVEYNVYKKWLYSNARLESLRTVGN